MTNRVKRLDSAVSVIYTLASHTVYHVPILTPVRKHWYVEIREHEIIVRNSDGDEPLDAVEVPSKAAKWNRVLVEMEGISDELK